MTDSPLSRRALLKTTVAGTASLLGGQGMAARDTESGEPPVHEEYLVDVHPGVPVWVRLRVDPGGADQLLYEPPEFVTVHGAHGFDRIPDGHWWDGTARPQLVYTVSPRFSWGLGERGGFVSTAELTLPTATATTRSVTLANGGYIHPDPAGQSYVGPAQQETRSVAGTPVTYVRPNRWGAPTAPPAATFFDIVETTADTLSLSNPYPAIGYAAPTLDSADGFAKRATIADTAKPHFAFVGDSLRTIAHEYVHTQQAYFAAREYAWLLEGVATFYEHVVGYRHGLLALSPLDGASKERPLLGARRTSVVYDKGAAMCFLLDQRLRDVSEGETTLSDVVQALNARDSDQTISHETFTDIVADVSGVRLDSWLDERILDPFEIALPADLHHHYSGPARPRPRVETVPKTVRPGQSNNWLLVGFEVDTTDRPLDTVELRLTVEGPSVVQINSVGGVGTDDRPASVSRSGGPTDRGFTRTYAASDAPSSLTAMAPVRASLEPTGVGATTLSITGTVTRQDGTSVDLEPTVLGTRAVVETPPPPAPTVLPHTMPAGTPVDLFVLDPQPGVRYLWRFAGSEHTQAVGSRVRRRFSLLGEQSVEVTAIDRTGDQTTATSTIQVTEDDVPGRDELVDPECLIRQQRFGDIAGSWMDGGRVPIDLVRRCYDGVD